MKKTVKTGFIEKIVNGGWGILRDDEGVVFLNGVCPGEKVEYIIKEKAKGVLWGRLLKIIDSSDIRREPECRYSGKCGGCSMLHIKYSEQLNIKRKILLDDLKRIGGINNIMPESVYSREYGYRIRVKLKGVADGTIGFIRKGTNEVMPIDECLLASERINNFIKEWNKSAYKPFFHQLDLFDNSDRKKLFVFLSMKPDAKYKDFLNKFTETIFSWKENIDKGVSQLMIGDFKYFVSPEIFFQVNRYMWRNMLEIVKNHLEKSERIADLYSGNGFFIPVIKLFSSDITAVESNKRAVEMANRSFSDVKFIRSDVDKYKLEKFDIVVTDPPRSGLSTNLKKMIVFNNIKILIYISCSTATLSRDLHFFLSEGYEIKKMTMLDMFPNTSHIETVTLLNRKG